MQTHTRQALIWRAWWIVTVLMCAFFTAYAWRVHDFIASRLESQIKILTVLTRSHVLQSFAEIDESLRGVRFEFEISGPGIDESKLKASSTPDTAQLLAPFRCMVLVNSTGDAYLRSPTQCYVPDLGTWIEEIQNRLHTPDTIYTTYVPSADTGNARLIRAIVLQYPDGSFGGLAMALLDTEKILGHLGESGYHGVQNRFSLIENNPFRNTQSMMQVHTPHGTAQLNMQLTYASGTLMKEWLGSVLPPFIGLLAVFLILWRGAKTLSEVVAQQAQSILLVERSKIENEIQAQFLANMNHELRTPMNGVLTAAELLSETSLQPHQQHLLQLIRRSGHFLLNIVNDVLDIGKIRAGKLTLENAPFTVLEALEDVANIVAPLVHDKGLLLLLEFDVHACVQIKGDKTRVQQIMLNLVSNAIKFTTQGFVSCRFYLEPMPNDVSAVMCCLEVQDTGIGMDMAQSQWLFQPFQQADISISRRFGGTGLGLAIVRQLVHMMDGTVTVSSHINEGSTFRVQWPTLQVPTPSIPVDEAWQSLVVSFVLQPGIHQAPLTQSLYVHAKHLGLRCIPPEEMDAPQWRTCHRVILTNASHEALAIHTRTAGTSVIQLCTPGEVWQLKIQDSPSQLLSLSCPLRRCDIEKTLRTLIASHQTGPVATLPANDIAAPQPLGLRILVAEDNSVNQVLIRQILTNLGCQVDLSRDGQEALDLFEKNSYDVILMDCQMPIMDGFKATQNIRAHELATPRLKPRTPIVALTAMTLETDIQLCLDVGMDDYLSKPLDKTLLEKKLRHWSSLQTNASLELSVCQLQ